PVLLCAFMRAHQHETTLYREGSLLPIPSVADWEVLLRRPELFSVVGVRVSGPRQSILTRLSQSLGVETAVLPIVRDLIRRVRTLPDFAWRTQQVTAHTHALRQALDTAHSPERLLFHDLPTALGLSPFANNQTTEPKQIELFFERLNASLQELAQALPNAIDIARDHLLTACDFTTGEKGWEAFRREAAVLLPYINQPNLLPLLKRAAETEQSEMALESVLAYIANRPPRNWSDSEVQRFPDQAEQLGKLYKDERRGYDPMAGLSPIQRKEGQKLAIRLQQYVSREVDADLAVKLAALRTVLKELDQQPAANGRHADNVAQPLNNTTKDQKGE
ncbi:MAG: hypothetical protein KC413_11725, partial [Anaerolineales bacterium]|nr:hypothetical protein [Anaerolineales bacterium]